MSASCAQGGRCRMRSTRLARRRELRQHTVGKLPAHQLLEKRIHVGGAPILVIEIVRVLPKVESEQRPVAALERGAGVVRAGNLDRAVSPDQPQPAAAELRAGGGPEARDETLVGPEASA